MASGTDGGGEVRPLGRDDMAAVWFDISVFRGLGLSLTGVYFNGECFCLLTIVMMLLPATVPIGTEQNVEALDQTVKSKAGLMAN